MRQILNYSILGIILLFASVTVVARESVCIDGPYILHLPNGGIRIISTNAEGEILDKTFPTIPNDFSFPVVSHDAKHQFQVKLHAVNRQHWKCNKPEKLMVMSDPHGKMDYFVSVLRGNNVINEQYEWIYGKNHLMIIGDVFDRGKDVLPIFWLIYKLEKEAQDAGGQVSFLLGNHETMVLAGDFRYMEKCYIDLADKLGMEYQQLFAPETELGHWLATRNTMQVVGDDLFVHAGLGKEFLEKELSIQQVNEEINKGLFLSKQERNELSELTRFLYGNQGPVWYRGMVRNDEKYTPLYSDVLERLLAAYHVKRIIVGHTIFPDVRV
ncbi:metallophosphoesterase, partial [Bacteroides sp. OttesenSCG-928-E20]|nr:metallophosphoesterase [Bacteroides sp. OttesenSCG-928-E20]